jgi:thioester reductase-like protein
VKAAGLHVYAAVPVFYNCTLVLGPSTKPPSGELVSQIMKLQRLKSIYTAPAVLEGLVIERGGLEQASQLDFVMFSGGPLSPSAGDSLSKVTDVCQVIGQTETAIIPALVPERDRWSYFEWQPFYGVRMEPDGDDLYEMVIPKNLKLSMFQTVCYTFPDIQEWRTKDLFAQHPENPELWRFHGRKDDIIVLSNGEKFNPVTMEGIILGSPLLSGALIVGTARFQAALLIEAKEHVVMSADELIEEVWPFVQRANDYGPAHAQIFRAKIGVASRDKPFQRAGKGTVVRSKTNDEYSDEIEGLYSHAATYQEQGLPELKKPYSKENVALWVRTCMAQFLTVPDGEDLDTADFFVLGLDSLKAAELINAFRSCLESDLDERRLELITPKAIYANPNLESLSTFLYELLNPESSAQNGAAQTQVTRAEHMEAMIRRHTADLPQRKTAIGGINSVNGHLSPKTLTVALTGSTGSLGSTLLENLLADPKISKIYCLNRTADAQDRQQKSFKVRGLQPDLSKATFIKAEFGLPQLGIPDSTFQALKENVDVIIHNAWKVDFNHPLSSFEVVHIHGVRHLIDWSLASRRHPRIYFVSSVSSVGNWAALRGASMPVPEEIQTDHDVAMHQGYGESKHVAEGILAGAAERAGVPCTILRIGQIAGPLEGKGMWNEREWVPSLIRTSRAMGLLPDRLPGIDWIPVDRLSLIILELIHAGSGGPDNHNSGEDTIQVFNLVNPHVTEWSDLISPILKRFGPSLKIVPLRQWIQGLRGTGAGELEEKPAAKIIEFFEGMEGAVERGLENRYVTANGEGASGTMKGLEGVSGGWMDIWLRQWGF